MPLYEYKCQSCGETFEVIQKFSDAPIQVHEKCGGNVERLVSPPALQFKGSGWYVTDYGNGNGNGKNQPAKDGKKEAKSESSTGGSKTETKTPSTSPASSSDKKV